MMADFLFLLHDYAVLPTRHLEGTPAPVDGDPPNFQCLHHLINVFVVILNFRQESLR